MLPRHLPRHTAVAMAKERLSGSWQAACPSAVLPQPRQHARNPAAGV